MTADLYLFYGSAGGHVITAARGRRNYILPIFLAGNLSTCKHIHLFWSHSVIPTGHLVLAGYLLFLLVVFSVTTGLTMVPPGAYMVPTGPQTPLDLGRCDAYGLVTSS
ncbi:hypothetical protein Tco_1480413 [Tanacetum coccineum]